MLLARLRSPSYMPRICGTIMCDSSMKHEEVVGEVVEQAVGRGARLLAEQDARVVLDAAAVAHLAQHLHVVLGALAQAVRLEELAVAPRTRRSAPPSRGWISTSARSMAGLVGDEVGGRVDGHVLAACSMTSPLDRVEADDLLDLVAPELHADGGVLRRPARSRRSRRARGTCRARGSKSLRAYWMSTSLRSISSRSTSSPTCSSTICSRYSSGEPRP